LERLDGRVDARAVAPRAEADIPERRQMGQERRVLRHVADAPLLGRKPHAPLRVEHHLAADRDAAARPSAEAGEHLEKRRLARAPNSPRAREKARTLPARMPRHASGRVTRKKARAGPQPRVRAIPTRRGSTSSKAVRAERSRSGNDITMVASKTAFQVKTISMPRSP